MNISIQDLSIRREQVTQDFAAAILDVVNKSAPVQPDERLLKFEGAARQALEVLPKEDIIEMIMFLITDHEVFLDIFQRATKAT